VQIRLLSTGDESLLRQAARQHLDRNWPLARCARALADPDFVALAAIESGAPVSLAYGYVLDRLHQVDLLLYSIDVAQSHHRRGIGRAMLEALKTLCLERGYAEMWVLTNASNAAAMRLYASAGGVREFEDVEMFAYPTPGHPVDD